MEESGRHLTGPGERGEPQMGEGFKTACALGSKRPTM